MVRKSWRLIISPTGFVEHWNIGAVQRRRHPLFLHIGIYCLDTTAKLLMYFVTLCIVQIVSYFIQCHCLLHTEGPVPAESNVCSLAAVEGHGRGYSLQALKEKKQWSIIFLWHLCIGLHIWGKYICIWIHGFWQCNVTWKTHLQPEYSNMRSKII